MDPDQCSICCESYTKVLRKPVACPYCPRQQCVQCVKQYLLSSSEDPHCMHCRTAWNPEYIDEKLSRHWRLGDYKQHRGQILVSREKANLIRFQECSDAAARHHNISVKIAVSRDRMRTLKKEIDDLRIQEVRMRVQLQNLAGVASGNIPPSAIDQDGNVIRHANGDTAPAATEAAKKFTMPCPGTDCRGLLNHTYHCTLCKKWCCKDCLSMRDERDLPHECNKDDRDTVALILSTSKPCPKCNMRIQKTDGCDQMWCTQCQTPFSWRTGKEVVGGVIHNPHFYDWVRRTGGEVPRNPLDNPCGGNENTLPRYGNLATSFLPGMTVTMKNEFRDCHRALGEISERQRGERQQPNNIDLGVLYIRGEMTENQWKLHLEKRERIRMFEDEVHAIYGTLLQVGIQKLRELIATPHSAEQILRDLHAVRDFTIEAFQRVESRFKWSTPIVKGWSIQHHRLRLK